MVKSDFEEAPLFELINFQTVEPDPALIPYQAFTHAINRSIEEYKKKLFYYESPMGFTELREALKERFAQDGIYASSSQIMITNGAQQGIYLALKSIFLASPEKKLLVEAPTYPAVLNMAKALNINYVTIRRDVSGVDLHNLEAVFQSEQIKAFYLIPRYHNPTGYSLSEKEKRGVIELCNRYNVLVIEDDYLADLGMDKRSFPLHYYDTNQLTIYIRSFSKTFLPGLRLGAMVIPEALCASIHQQKYLSDISTSGITQGALNIYIRSGMYDLHINKVNACYRRKLTKAKAILSMSKLEEVAFHVPKQGLFLWITLPVGISAHRIADKLAQNNILVSHYVISDEEPQGLRLCISGVPERDMNALENVIRIIKDNLHERITDGRGKRCI